MPIFAAPPPAVVGHRGAPRRAPENTLEAFLAAAEEGAGWVELDARRTADGQVVVVHDATGPDGVPVADLPAPALAARGLALLADVLDALPPGLGVDVELKNLPGEPDYDEQQRLASLVAPLLAARLGTRPLAASSFNPLALEAVRASVPDLPLGLLTVPTLALAAGADLAVEFAVDAVFPHVTAPDLDAAHVAAAHARGLEVMVWTVDDPGEARRLAAAGVDALCTNAPALVAAALRA